MSQTINYTLSQNDLDVIKYHTEGKEISSIAKKALTILSITFGGLHHIPSSRLKKFPWFDQWMCELLLAENLSTYDSNRLTTLLILAHELSVRIEILPCNPHYLKIQFHERVRDGDFSQRHPTIEKAVSDLRETFVTKGMST